MNTETYVPIKDLKVGRYHQIFFVSKITHNPNMTTSTGNFFAKVVLKDITGEMEGVVWNYIPDLHLKEGQYHHINLITKFHQGRLEFSANFNNIFETQVPLNIHDYMKGISEGSLNVCATIVEEAIETMTDEHYRNVIGNAIQRLNLIHALKTSPYGLSGPLAYSGGLLIHVSSSLRLAKAIIEQTQIPINTSLLVASCILRNIGWHTTTCFINGYLRPKDAFYMTGINRASARYIDHLMIHVESDLGLTIPEAKKQALENSCDVTTNIRTIEGMIAASIDSMIDLLYFGEDALRVKTKEIFTGHIQ